MEGLLNVNGGDRFELDHFLSPPPELADGWWGDSSVTVRQHNNENAPRHPTPPSRARATSNRLINTARAVVTNTPLRSTARGAQHVGTPIDAGLSSPGFDRGTEGRVDDVVTSQTMKETRSGIQLNVADTSEGDKETCEAFGGEDPRERANADLARAWGLKDPTVARAMMKRAKRMRKFQNGGSRREKLKDPDVRFDAFARNAGRRRTASRLLHRPHETGYRKSTRLWWKQRTVHVNKTMLSSSIVVAGRFVVFSNQEQC